MICYEYRGSEINVTGKLTEGNPGKIEVTPNSGDEKKVKALGRITRIEKGDEEG